MYIVFCMLLLLWILNNNDNDNNNICSERGRRNSLLVYGSCIALPHLLFLIPCFNYFEEYEYNEYEDSGEMSV